MYQQVTVIGRVGKDLEMKGSVGKFSIATTQKWNKDGQPQEETTWFNCDLFGKMATGVGQYIKKGGIVHVTGRIKTNEYNGKTYWGVSVAQVTLLSKAPDQQQRQPQQQQQQYQQQYNPQQQQQQQFNQQQQAPNMDDIPF